MFPTITGGDDFAKRLASKIANDVEQGVEIARRGANDESGRVYQATLDRIVSKHNAHDRAVQRAANENAMSAQKAYNETIKRILDQHNDHTYSRGFLKRRSPFNDNSTDRIQDTIMYPVSPIGTKGAYEDTLDKIMGRHNAHGVEFPGYANDEDWSIQRNKWLGKHFPQMKGDWSDLPEYANDSQWKRKRIIHPYKPGVAQADRSELLLTDEVMEDGNIQKRRRRRKKTAPRLLSEDDSMDNVTPTELSPILDNIDENVQKMTESVEIIRDRIIDLTDEMGVDSLRGQERDLEDNHGYNHAGSKKGSSMAREGKEDSKDKDKDGILTKLARGAIGLGVLGTGAGAVIGGEAMGGETPVSKGGGYTGDKTHKSAPTQTQPQRAPSAEDTRPKSMRTLGPPPKGDRAKYELWLYEAFRNTGMTHEGAKTMVAQVGRENNFNPKYLFGTHIDPGNGALNAGMISWQKDRAEKLKRFMNDRGLVGRDGNFENSQRSLEAQAQFLDMEMRNSKKMKAARDALFDPTKKYEDIEGLVGDKVIAWRRHDPKYRASGYKNQNRAYGEITNLTEAVNRDGTATRDDIFDISNLKSIGKGKSINQQSARQTAANNVNVTVNNNTQNNVGSTEQSKKETKKTPPPARGSWWSDFYGKYFAPGV